MGEVNLLPPRPYLSTNRQESQERMYHYEKSYHLSL
nr:MAG TPA: hypothetical protein [Caudoviricetes sp.]